MKMIQKSTGCTLEGEFTNDEIKKLKSTGWVVAGDEE